MKLSKTQLAMLERMGTGDVLTEHHFGADIWYAWRGDYQLRGMRSATVFKLKGLGLIVAEGDWKGWDYSISDKGREYLEEARRQKRGKGGPPE